MTQEELNQVAGVVTTLMKEKIDEIHKQFDAKIAELKPQQAAALNTNQNTNPAAAPEGGTLPGIGALIGNPFDPASKPAENPKVDDITAQLSEQLKISQELNRKLIGSLSNTNTPAQPSKTPEEVLADAIR